MNVITQCKSANFLGGLSEAKRNYSAGLAFNPELGHLEKCNYF